MNLARKRCAFPIGPRVSRYRFVWLIFILCLPTLGHAARAQAPRPVVLNDLGSVTLPLSGTWQFHVGDNPAWASPSYDDSAWEPIEVGRSWEGQGHRNYTGFAWYRRQLVWDPGRKVDWNLALYLTHVDSSCEVYWNGVKVGSYGKVPPHPVWYGFGGEKRAIINLGPPRSGTLAIRVWKAPIVFLNSPQEGGLFATPQVGSAEAVAALETAARYRRSQNARFSLIVASVCGVVGFLSLLLWLRNRKQRMLLWLALVMLLHLAVYLLFNTLTLPFRVGYGLIGPLVAINAFAIWFLLIVLLGLQDRKRLVRWTWILAGVEAALDLVEGMTQSFDWTTWPPHLSHRGYGAQHSRDLPRVVGPCAGICSFRQTARSIALDVSHRRTAGRPRAGGSGYDWAGATLDALDHQ
jgi:drug/metabolite transporter superfamily protein YnfA